MYVCVSVHADKRERVGALERERERDVRTEQ